MNEVLASLDAAFETLYEGTGRQSVAPERLLRASLLRRMCVTPHVARNDTVDKHGRQRSSSIDGRTTRHPGYTVSQRARKRIEEAFAWVKTIAGCAKAKLRGTQRVAFGFTFAMAAYNLIRMPGLLAEAV